MLTECAVIFLQPKILNTVPVHPKYSYMQAAWQQHIVSENAYTVT